MRATASRPMKMAFRNRRTLRHLKTTYNGLISLRRSFESIHALRRIARHSKNCRRRLLVIGMSLVGVVLALWHLSRHYSERERARVNLIYFIPNDTEMYRICDKAFLPDFGSMSQSGYNIPVSPYDTLERFTVLTMVFNRFQSYREVIQHYICMPFVDRLVLLWANQEVDPPTKESINVNFIEKLFVRRLKSDAMTRRFANFPEIQTDAVFNVDDDKLVSVDDLQRAFKVWKKHPWGIVGHVPRCCNGTGPDLNYEGESSPWSYRLILTSAAFLHREYLRLFDEKIPAELRADIDRNKNCEDILMNFLVREHCKCSGLFYVGLYGEFRIPKHISEDTNLCNRPNHYQQRTTCVRRFLNLYSKTVNFTASSCFYD